VSNENPWRRVNKIDLYPDSGRPEKHTSGSERLRWKGGEGDHAEGMRPRRVFTAVVDLIPSRVGSFRVKRDKKEQAEGAAVASRRPGE